MTTPPRTPATTTNGNTDAGTGAGAGDQSAPSLAFDTVPGPGPGRVTYGVGDLGFVLADDQDPAHGPVADRGRGPSEAVHDDAADWW